MTSSNQISLKVTETHKEGRIKKSRFQETEQKNTKQSNQENGKNEDWEERRGTNVDVELTDEAREIAVFKVFRQELSREEGRVRDNEAVVVSITSPRDDGISTRVVDHLVAFPRERRH